MKPIRLFLLLGSVLMLLANCKRELKVEEKTLPGHLKIIGTISDIQFIQVIKTKDEHYVICGAVKDGLNGGHDGFVMKLDENFKTLWIKDLGGVQSDGFNGMVIDDEGNIFLAGFSYSYGVSMDSSYHHENALFYNVLIDPNGNEKWHKTFQARPGGLNVHNKGVKVFLMKDQSFVVCGDTYNWNRDDIFCYAINKQGDNIWSRRLYSVDRSYEISGGVRCANAIFTDDNNIILIGNGVFLSQINQTLPLVLLKIPSNGSSFSTNGFIWQGTVFPDLHSESEYSQPLPAESAGGDNVVVADWYNKGIVLFSDKGTRIKKISFKNKTSVANIRREGDKLLITGYSPNSIISTDLQGNILGEIYPESPELKNIDFMNVLNNSKEEFIVVGVYRDGETDKIVLLKYNKHWELK